LSLPSCLPADLVPDGATIYPPGGLSRPHLGNYVPIDITDPAGKASGSVFLPGSLEPNQMLWCAYIPAAMAAYREFLDGAPLSPATDCRVLSQQPCR
jgi:hypothetical protein